MDNQNTHYRERKFKNAEDVRKFLMKLYYIKYQDLPNSMIRDIIEYKIKHNLDNSEVKAAQVLGNSEAPNTLLHYNRILYLTKQMRANLQDVDVKESSEKKWIKDFMTNSERTISDVKVVLQKGKEYYKTLKEKEKKNKKGE